ncbi:MAG: RimK family protein [Deltaproteobacteria bacterium]|jgi:glutathione synthase/RimK-type ligase-like ATP-grasp enzyme|nr:RimK family protein [Deltaproteobacteria bacterium]
MSTLVVVNNRNDWPIELPNVEVVPARTYLTDPTYSTRRGAKVFNLCKSYRYQSLGYYVSLLAAARGHKPTPSVSAIQDMKSQTIIRHTSDELEELIQKGLHDIRSDKFVLSIYFGRNLAKRYERLSTHLFKHFEAPFLRAHFHRGEDGWYLQNVGPVPASEIPEEHRTFAIDAARDYFSGRRASISKRVSPRYHLAILYNPEEHAAPSNEKAIQRFIKAGEQQDLGVELIDKDDYGHIAEFDALFIRETTAVNHHTFRFARRAEFEGLVVVDDSTSILKCTNKVFLTESLERHKISAPKTMIVSKDNVDAIAPTLGFPVILKQPDSAFSQGVVKVESQGELDDTIERLLDKSELVIAQQFLPTTFDWRVGIWNREALFVCKYYMAKRHWQIVQRDSAGKFDYGKSETLPVELAPRALVRLALKAANLIGDGLYGVDVKEVDGKYYLIEVNDNPNIDYGTEDLILKEKLYQTIIRGFVERIERKKERSLRA